MFSTDTFEWQNTVCYLILHVVTSVILRSSENFTVKGKL